MLLNLVLLALVFGASLKKKLKPYQLGLILGGIKAALYLVFTRSILDAIVMGLVFGLLGMALLWLLDRLDKKPKKADDPAKMYRSVGVDTGTFQWEYVPLAGIVLFLLGGEWLLSLVAVSAK